MELKIKGLTMEEMEKMSVEELKEYNDKMEEEIVSSIYQNVGVFNYLEKPSLFKRIKRRFWPNKNWK